LIVKEAKVQYLLVSHKDLQFFEEKKRFYFVGRNFLVPLHRFYAKNASGA